MHSLFKNDVICFPDILPFSAAFPSLGRFPGLFFPQVFLQLFAKRNTLYIYSPGGLIYTSGERG